MWPPPPHGLWVDHPQPPGLLDAPGPTKQLSLPRHKRGGNTTNQAALTLFRRTLASERDFSQAGLQRKAFVSSDHLPPTSPAITTIRTRPFENPQSVDESVEAPERAKEPSARLGQDPRARRAGGVGWRRVREESSQLQTWRSTRRRTFEASP